MDQQLAVESQRSRFPIYTSIVTRAFNDFDLHLPPEIRVTVEDSRPKFVSCRMMHYLEMEFGTAGNPRVVKDTSHQLNYLYDEGSDYCVGIRAKKLNDDWRSYNHWSHQQAAIRLDGVLPWYDDAYQLFLGYRASRGLQPALTHIALTFENRFGVQWVTLLWAADEGDNPVIVIQPPLPLPPAPMIRTRRKNAGSKGNNGQEQTG